MVVEEEEALIEATTSGTTGREEVVIGSEEGEASLEGKTGITGITGMEKQTKTGGPIEEAAGATTEVEEVITREIASSIKLINFIMKGRTND